MLILTAACLIGVLVGLLFRVMALIPVELALVLVCLAIGDTVLAAIFNFVLATISLQAGYMIGVIVRELLSRIGAERTELPQ